VGFLGIRILQDRPISHRKLVLEAVYCSSCTAHPRSRVLLILDRDEEHVRRAAKMVASEL
jgi:hypothetical protein